MWGFRVRSLFCFAVLCFIASFVILSMGKRELAAFLDFLMPCGCYCSLPLPHGAMGIVVGLQCMIVAFPDHTHVFLVICIVHIVHLIRYTNALYEGRFLCSYKDGFNENGESKCIHHAYIWKD